MARDIPHSHVDKQCPRLPGVDGSDSYIFTGTYPIVFAEGDEPIMTIICGGTMHQAQAYADRHHFDRSKYRVVSRPDDLYGVIHGTLLIMVGKWHDSDDAKEVLEQGRKIGMATVQEIV